MEVREGAVGLSRMRWRADFCVGFGEDLQVGGAATGTNTCRVSDFGRKNQGQALVGGTQSKVGIVCGIGHLHVPVDT